jgi:hypothetical protein
MLVKEPENPVSRKFTRGKFWIFSANLELYMNLMLYRGLE